MGLLTLFDPATGLPLAVIDATGYDRHAHRRGHRARRARSGAERQKVLGHIGARGTAYWNVRLLHSALRLRRDSRPFAPERNSRRIRARGLRDLGANDPRYRRLGVCVRGADIVVEASRLPEPEPMLRTAWIKPSAFVVPYGTMSAVELSLTDIMDKIVVDDWGQCRTGQFGALRAHVDAGKLDEHVLHAELGEIVAGSKTGRERDDETILSGTAGCRSPMSRWAQRCSTRLRVSTSARRFAIDDHSRAAAGGTRRERTDVRGRYARRRSVEAVVRAACAGVRRGSRRHRPRAAATAARSLAARGSRLRVHLRLSVGHLERERGGAACTARRTAPLAARYGGRAVYCTDVVVRSDSRFVNVDDLRGARFAYTVEHSQSGWQAPRAYFADRALRADGRWFGESSAPCTRHAPSWPRSSRTAPMRDRSIRGGTTCCGGTTLQQHRSCARSEARR